MAVGWALLKRHAHMPSTPRARAVRYAVRTEQSEKEAKNWTGLRGAGPGRGHGDADSGHSTGTLAEYSVAQ
eukprot:3682205-Prymnesium_polylepis.1